MISECTRDVERAAQAQKYSVCYSPILLSETGIFETLLDTLLLLRV